MDNGAVQEIQRFPRTNYPRDGESIQSSKQQSLSYLLTQSLPPNIVTPRERMLNRVEEDLVGPMLGPEEVLSDRPSDVYITGILWPQTCAVIEDWEHDDTQEADSGVEGEGSGECGGE